MFPRYAIFLAAAGLSLLGQTPPKIMSTGKNRTGLAVHRKATEVDLRRQNDALLTNEITFEVEIQNKRSEATEIQVREPIYVQWQLLEASHPHTRVGTNAVASK